MTTGRAGAPATTARTTPLLPPITSRPSACLDAQTDVWGYTNCRVASSFLRTVSQSRSVPSSPTDAATGRSGNAATPVTGPLW